MSCTQRDDKLPFFAWRNFGRGIVVAICDLLILLVVALVAWLYVKYVLLHGQLMDRGVFRGEDWANIIKAVIWPLGSLLALFLFRNPVLLILYEVPGLIRRSWYRVGKITTPPQSGDKNIGSGAGDSVGEKSGIKNGKQLAEQAVAMQCKVLGQLQKEYNVPVLREMGIENSRFYFDGVMEIGRKIYGVEVKTTADEKIWKHTFDQMTAIYPAFSMECKGRFVFMACIAADSQSDKQKLEHLKQLAERNPFRTIVRWFPGE